MGFFRSSNKSAAEKEMKKAEKELRKADKERKAAVRAANIAHADLNNAKRKEKEWSREDLVDASIDQADLVGLQEHGDGVWVCCNGHENALVQFEGFFPFKYANCGQCLHTLCNGCHTSGILTSLTIDIHNAIPTGRMSSDTTCCVCTTCGLTHRSVAGKDRITFAEACRCGKVLRDSLFLTLFVIGSAKGFRRDPVQNAFDVKMQHIEAASKRAAAARAAAGIRRTQSEPYVSAQRDRRPY